MKTCEEFAALLDPFVDGELSAEDAARVQAHLNACRGCRAYVDSAMAIRAAFPDVEDTEVPDGFAEGVMASIRAGAAPQKRKKAPWGKVLASLAACCALVILVRGLPMFQPAPEETAESSLSTAASAGEAPQTPEAYTALEGDPAVEPKAALQADPGLPENSDLPAESAQDGAAAPDSENVVSPASDSAPEGGETWGFRSRGGSADDAPVFISVQLTTAQAGDLLADYVPCSEASGMSLYELTVGEYEALSTALQEQQVEPVVLESIPENHDDPAALAWVMVCSD